jgi:hypothetical protein
MTDEVNVPDPTIAPPIPAPVEQPPRVNSLLTKARLPGQTFRLPSNGLNYAAGVLSPEVSNGEVHVYPMAAIDEITIRSPDKLFSGDAVREVFSRCIPQILSPGSLYAKDIDFLMVCLRKVSYGEEFEVAYTHDCEDAKEHNYIIRMDAVLKKVKEIDPTTVDKKFTIPLSTGQVVIVHPILYDDMVAIMQDYDEDVTDVKEIEQQSLRSIASIITSVDGITDKVDIMEWLRILNISDAKKISNAIDSTGDWGTDLSKRVKCKDCGKMTTIVAPMNPISFFS